MLAHDVENIVRAKPNMSGSQIPLTGGVADTHTHTHSHARTQTHTKTDTLVHIHKPHAQRHLHESHAQTKM